MGGIGLRFSRKGAANAALVFITANASILMCILFTAISFDYSIEKCIPAGIGILGNIQDFGGASNGFTPGPGAPEFAIPGVETTSGTFSFFLQGIIKGILNAILALLVHEAGHILCALAFKCRLKDFKIKPVGISAGLILSGGSGKTKGKGIGTCAKAALITAAGPFMNLLVFTIILVADKSRIFELFAIANLFMAIFNLIPALPMDGGWLVFYLVEQIIGDVRAYKIMYRLSVALGILIIFAGIIQLVLSRGNFSMALAGAYIVYIAFKERTQMKIICTSKLIMRNLEPEYGNETLCPGVARITVAGIDNRPSEVMGYLDPGAFNIICVLNSKMAPVGFITERQLAKAAVSGDGLLGAAIEL